MSALARLLASAGDAGSAASRALAEALAADPEAVIVAVDLEACAAPGGDARDPDKARIVQVAIAEVAARPLPGQVDAAVAEEREADGVEVPAELERVEPGPAGLYTREDATLVDPLCEIDAGSAAVHGITDEAVEGAPRVDDLVDPLASAILPEGRRPILVGYNGARFDAPLLAAELRRAAGRLRRDDPARAALAERVAARVLEETWIDPLAIRRRAEPGDLAGSVRRYLGAELQGAHDARADIAATVLVLGAQLATRHAAGLADAEEASKAPPGSYDRAGKLAVDEGVDVSQATAAQVRFTFGKHKGATVAAEPPYARWMLTSDFPEETKARLRALLATLPADAGARGPRAHRR